MQQNTLRLSFDDIVTQEIELHGRQRTNVPECDVPFPPFGSTQGLKIDTKSVFMEQSGLTNIKKSLPFQQDLQSQVKNPKGLIIAVQCDLRKESDIMAVIKVCKENGGIDVCINNAGLLNPSPLLSGSTEQWREMMDVCIVQIYLLNEQACSLLSH